MWYSSIKQSIFSTFLRCHTFTSKRSFLHPGNNLEGLLLKSPIRDSHKGQPNVFLFKVRAMLFDLPSSPPRYKKKKTCSSAASKVIFIHHANALKKEKVFDNPVNNVTIKKPKSGVGSWQFISRRSLESQSPVCGRYQLLEKPERSLEKCLPPPQENLPPSSPRIVEPHRVRLLSRALQAWFLRAWVLKGSDKNQEGLACLSYLCILVLKATMES